MIYIRYGSLFFVFLFLLLWGVHSKTADAQSPAGTSAPGTQNGAGGGLLGGSNLSNPSISLLMNTSLFLSNIESEDLEGRGIPGFTTEGLEGRNGFNFREAELTVFSPVDPYFNLYAQLPISDEGIEVEELYVVTTALPTGLQIKGGKFKADFSRLNAQHPHAWDFQDVALPYRAFVGGEGLGGENGVQLTYIPALPIYVVIGADILQGDNALLFGPEAQSGSHAYAAYIKGSFDVGGATFYLGPFVLWGKTRTDLLAADTEFRGDSTLTGLEAVWKWKPSKQRSVVVQSEYLLLHQDGDLEDLVGATTDTLRRNQDGAYLQAVYQWNRWRFGARVDGLELLSDSYEQAGVEQDLGDKPWRASGEVEFNPTEFSRVRLQYDHDRSGRDGETNRQWVLQFIFGVGAHAAHPF